MPGKHASCARLHSMSSNRPVASLYARLSVAADDANTSLDGMVDDMKELCERSGYEVGAVHVDDGLTGGRRDRDKFQAWLDDAREGRAQVLVNPYTDRLTREGLQVAAAILDVVEGKDPQSGRIVHRPVRMVDLAGLDSEHGDAFRLRFVLQAEVARAERERIRARVRASQRRLIKAGRYRGGPTPYGYRGVERPDDSGHTLEVVEEEAACIREAIRRVLEGQTLNRVSRWANEAGYRPRKAAQWSHGSLRVVLLGQAILGRVSSKGELLRDEDGQPLTPFPPIIDLPTHNALREALIRKSRSTVPVKRSYLLSGLLRCWSCGSRLVASSNSRREPVYRCGSRGTGQSCGGQVSCSRTAIESKLTEVYLSRYGDEPMYRTFTVVEGVGDLAEIQEAIRDCLRDISQEATAERVERLQKLQQKRSEAEAKKPTKRTVRKPTGLTVGQWWEAAPVDDRRDALHAEFGTMELHPGGRGRHGFDMARLTFPDREDSGEE